MVIPRLVQVVYEIGDSGSPRLAFIMYDSMHNRCELKAPD